MKKFFSLKLYLEGLRKIKTAGIAAAITVVALNAIIPTIVIINEKHSMLSYVPTTEVIPITRVAPVNLAMMFFAAVLVYSMFSYLNERNKCDFWHAIPQTRECVYFSFTAAVWTWIAGVIIASTAVNVILWSFAKYSIVTAGAVFASAGVYLLGALLIASFMAVAMTLTGTVVSNLLILVLLMFFIRVMGVLFVLSIEELVPVIDVSRSFWRVFEIDFYLPISLLSFDEDTFANGLLLGYSALAVVALVALGALCYRKRRSEMATKSAPSTFMQHVYRCAVTLPFIFLTVTLILIDTTDVTTVFVLLIVSLLVWIIYELMTTKKIRNVAKSLPVILVPLAISLLLTGCVYAVRGGVYGNVPEVDDIKGITITSSRSQKNYEQIAVDDIVVGSPTLNQTVADAYAETVRVLKQGTTKYVDNSRRLVIHLRSGRKLGRYVSMDEKTYLAVKDEFYQSDAYRNAYLSLPSAKQVVNVSFSRIGGDVNAEARIWESFVAEYQTLTDEQKRVVKEWYDYGYTYYSSKEVALSSYALSLEDLVGTVYVFGSVKGESFTSQYPILYPYMPRTAQLYLDVYNRQNNELGDGASESFARVYEIALAAQKKPEHLLHGFIRFDVLYGDSKLENARIDMYSDEKEKNVEGFVDFAKMLTELSSPEDYSHDISKTVAYCVIELGVASDLLSDEQYYHKGDQYYYYEEVAVALTAEEVEQILAAVVKQTPQ